MATDENGNVVRKDGKPLRISHSLLETFEPQQWLQDEKDLHGCRRKAFYSSILFKRGTPGEGAVVGKNVHKVQELYLTTGELPRHIPGFERWWTYLEPALEFLPTPAEVASGLWEVERLITTAIEDTELIYKGYSDLISDELHWIDDLKCSSNPRTYHKRAADLVRFNQPLSYAYAEWHEDPPSKFTVSHSNVSRFKNAPDAFRITAEVSWQQAVDNWHEYVLPTAKKVIATFGPAESPEDVPANTRACRQYATRGQRYGCPHAAYCSALRGVEEPKVTPGVVTMSSKNKSALAKLNAMKNAHGVSTSTSTTGSRTAPTPAPKVPTTAAAPAAPSAEMPAGLVRLLEQCPNGAPRAAFDVVCPGKAPEDYGLVDEGGAVRRAAAPAPAPEPEPEAEQHPLRGKKLTELRALYPDGMDYDALVDANLCVSAYLVVDTADKKVDPISLWEKYGYTAADFAAETQAVEALRATKAPAPAAAPVVGPEAGVAAVDKAAESITMSETCKALCAKLEASGRVALEDVKATIRETQNIKGVHSKRIAQAISEVQAHRDVTWDGKVLSRGSGEMTDGSEEVGTGLTEGVAAPEPPAPAAAPVHASPEPLTQGESPERAEAYAEGYERGKREARRETTEDTLVLVGSVGLYPLHRRQSFDEFMRPFVETVQNQEGTVHYGLVPYAQGPKMVAAALAVAIKNGRVEWPSEIVCEDPYHPLLSECLPLLKAVPSVRVIRSVR